jgi:hypothetical protein
MVYEDKTLNPFVSQEEGDTQTDEEETPEAEGEEGGDVE